MHMTVVHAHAHVHVHVTVLGSLLALYVLGIMTCTEPISGSLPFLCQSIWSPKTYQHYNPHQASTPALAPQPCVTGVLMPSMTLKSFGEVITFHTP
jgi:hypothetical protein